MSIESNVCKECESRNLREQKWFLAYWPLLLVVPVLILAGAAYLFKFYNGVDCDISALMCKSFKDVPDAWGQFGDFVGGIVNPIVGVFTIILLVGSLNLSRIELRETRKAASAASVAQVKMEVSMREQLEEARKQNIRNHYYTHLGEFHPYSYDLIQEDICNKDVINVKKLHFSLFPQMASGNQELWDKKIKIFSILVHEYCESVLYYVRNYELQLNDRGRFSLTRKELISFVNQPIFLENQVAFQFKDEYKGKLVEISELLYRELKLIHDLLSFEPQFDEHFNIGSALKQSREMAVRFFHIDRQDIELKFVLDQLPRLIDELTDTLAKIEI